MQKRLVAQGFRTHRPNAMYNLSGKVALVTGAGGERGFGRAIAVRFAQEGADLIVNDVVQKILFGSFLELARPR